MARGSHRSLRRVGVIALALMLALPLPARADGHCYYDPVGGQLVCEGGGGGGTPGGPPVADDWTSWTLVGACGGGGAIGGGLVDIRTGLLAATRDHIVDGVVVETQMVCIDLNDAAAEIWAEVASAAAALPDPGWEANPDGVISKGLTGLETWLWYSNPSQVGPIDATWTDPVTGLVFGVRGRGWTESITWDTGQGRYDVFAPTWDGAPTIGGSQDAPAATHFYNTTSAAAGYPNGYPVGVELHWVGEYQVRVIAGVWTGWAGFPSTLTEVFPGTYEVVEVRSKLSG